jgi:hypothetical protein
VLFLEKYLPSELEQVPPLWHEPDVTASLPAFAVDEIVVCFAWSSKAAHASTWSVKRPSACVQSHDCVVSRRILVMFVAVLEKPKP